MRVKQLGATCAMSLGFAAAPALADYPEHPTNILIPYGAGGATDISTRSIAEPLGAAASSATIIAGVSGESLLLATIGLDPVYGTNRFTFGDPKLMGG